MPRGHKRDDLAATIPRKSGTIVQQMPGGQRRPLGLAHIRDQSAGGGSSARLIGAEPAIEFRWQSDTAYIRTSLQSCLPADHTHQSLQCEIREANPPRHG